MKSAMILACLTLSSPLPAQHAPQCSAAPVTLPSDGVPLSGILPGSKTIRAVKLQGTAHFINGSRQEDGTINLETDASGMSKLSLTVGTETRMEQQSVTKAGRACTWTGTDGKVHETRAANCWTPLTWFFPQLTLDAANATSALAIEDRGLCSDERGSFRLLRHRLVIASPKTSQEATNLIGKWSTTDLKLDPKTSLPERLEYTSLSEGAKNRPVPVWIEYADYREVSGVPVPFRIRKYLNGTLLLDISIDTATLQ